MPVISAGDLALLRQKHKAKFYLSICPATVLWSAQVAGAHTREAVSIAFDGGSGANFNAITSGMELWIGTSAGEHDVDRVRVKSISSGDSGVTGTVTVSLNSVVWADNQHLTFVGWFLLKPRKPDIGDDGTFYKDGGSTTGGITYSDQNSQPSPVTIAGENRANFLDPDSGEWTIASQLPSSYAIANGATISSYAASLVYGPDTPTISVNSGTGVGTVTFDTPGLYWIKWTCTDSNGKSQDTYRYYYAHSTNPQSAHYPFTRFSINNVQGQWNNGGWSAGIQVHGNVDLDTIPDYAPVILWAENWYGATKKNITFLPDQSGTVIGGYIRRDKFAQDVEKGAHVADFSITTIQGVADNKYNFSVSLEAAQSVDTWWKYPSWLTPTRGVHHFLKWHSTLLEIADVIGLNSNTDGDSHVEFPDGSLFERANSALAVIRSRLVCNAGGRVVFVEDVQLRPDSERSGLTEVQEITDADKNGSVDFPRAQEKQVPFYYLAAFDYDGDFDADGKPIVASRCAIAPGNNGYDDGPQPESEGKQIVVDQAHANQIVGRLLHAENNEYPEITVPMVGRLGVLAIHLSEFWTYTSTSGETARKVTKTFNLILRQVTAAINVEQGTIACTATFEAEANGPEGIATECPGFPDLPDTDFEIPDAESELGGALMTASSINYLPPQSKSWEERSAEGVQDAYADPHWRIKQDSIASADAIIWRCGTGYIKRSVDAGENWIDVTPPSLPSGIVFIRGEGSYVVDQEHVFIGRWEDGGTWFSRIYYTNDDGANWTEQDVSGGGAGFGTEEDVTGGAPTLNLQHIEPTARTIVPLSSSKFLLAYSVSGGGNAVVGTVSGSTITYGSPVAFSTSVKSLSACLVDTDTVCIVWRENGTTGADNDAFLRIATISGTTITYGTAHQFINGSGEAWTGHDDYVIAALSTTKVIVAFGGGSSTSSQPGGYTFVANIDGTSIDSVGSYTTFATDVNRSIGFVDISVMSSTQAVITYNAGTANNVNDPVALVADISGDTVTVGSVEVATTDNSRYGTSATLGSSKFIYAYRDSSMNIRARVGTVSSSTISFGTEATIRTGDPFNDDILSFSMVAISSTQAILFFVLGDLGLEEYPIAALTMSISGTSITAGSEYTGPEVVIPGTAVTACKLSSGLFVAGYQGTNTTAIPLSLLGTEAKALGMSVGKGLGEILYLTAWDGSGLVLMLYSLPGLVLIDNISLGTASEAEVDANTWIARPYTPFGDDMACYVYGRMNDPLATGTVHLMISEDEALSFVELEQGWGSNHCASLLEDFGKVMAVRNLASSSKLYVGNVGDVLKVALTLPFSTQVNPQALAFDWAMGALYVGAASSDEFMIVVVPEPSFSKAYDLTFNHDTTNGIRSVIVL